MRKILTLEFSGAWVLEHRDDEKLPVAVMTEELQKTFPLEVKGSSFTELSLSFDGDKIASEEVSKKISEIFAAQYPQDIAEEVLTVSSADSVEEEETEPEEAVTEEEAAEDEVGDEEDRSASDSEQIRRRLRALIDGADEDEEERAEGKAEEKDKVVEEVGKLVGAQEFKALVDEVVRVAPEILRRKTEDVFIYRSYLFSIGDGCGLSTYLRLFARLLSAVGVRRIASSRSVVELKIAAVREGKDASEAFEEVTRALNGGDKKSVRILCVDISEWINKTDGYAFRQLLRQIENKSDEFIVVFRVPFLEKDVLERLRFSLNDLLFVKTVSFPPLTQSEIRKCAQNEIEKYGFKVSKSAWEYFDNRINEEKGDGRFYGLKTVGKVVRELVYKKELSNAANKADSDVISRKDMKSLCASSEPVGLSGYEKLNRLVGCESVSAKIKEIVAQIALARRENNQCRPCIHMRFVGNPGTGKTTVARILGQILKEEGVLRIGNFIEIAGRDLCGRYVGETAPKTAGICRDAYGSVLFIDEAYSLFRGDGNDRDFGREALDTLIAEMENHRDDFVVIMAGYTDDIEKMMKGNAGLASRVPYAVEFPNFSREQLYGIFVSMVKEKFKYGKTLFEAAHEYFIGLPEDLLSSKEFSNARFVRNLFERTWAKAAMRCQLEGKSPVVITKEDFTRACGDKEFSYMIPKKTRIGF